jgi:starch phosphorylase
MTRFEEVAIHGLFDSRIRWHARYTLGKSERELTPREQYLVVSFAARDYALDQRLETEERFRREGSKRLYYLSMEFLIGRSLENNLINLGLLEVCRDSLAVLGIDLASVLEQETDAALGNGGLGRLAACFLDSLATLDMPGFGYGLNYAYGLFRQEIHQGWQREHPDSWVRFGSPWQIAHPEDCVHVPVYGRIEHGSDRDGGYNPMWLDWRVLEGVPYDMPVVGHGGKTVNYLRLYSARARADFDVRTFNSGDYVAAVHDKIRSETVSKVLYPSDSTNEGKELRLLQEYFFTACAIRDITTKHLASGRRIEELSSAVAIQLNDTHPAIAVAELMRILIDEHALTWEAAWSVVQGTLAYTNHTLMPEALERWPLELFERVVPRHLQLIREIDRRFLGEVEARWPGDAARRERMRIVVEGAHGEVRMAHLAIVGSHAINGVAVLHSELVKSSLVPDFYAMWPERFQNKTNGITPRRWLLVANPQLAKLVTGAVGSLWVADLDRLREIERFAGDPGFQHEFARIKRDNKERLARLLLRDARVKLDPSALFDVQAKRMHEYKRQLLLLMHVVHQYLELVDEGRTPRVPRATIFAGKAAPGYWNAKRIIKLIHNVAEVINTDPRAKDWLKVAFAPDYRVTLAERIIPAADLSEQISTAGMEASGTGNMKFALNGALTMGTLDGANIEIRDAVGPENVFIFGLTAAEVEDLRHRNAYRPREYYERDPRVRRIVDALSGDRFARHEPEISAWLRESLLERGDFYFHLADLGSYIDAQERASATYADPASWWSKAIANTARMGHFSSDRTIREYARDIWNLASVPPAAATPGALPGVLPHSASRAG